MGDSRFKRLTVNTWPIVLTVSNSIPDHVPDHQAHAVWILKVDQSPVSKTYSQHWLN